MKTLVIILFCLAIPAITISQSYPDGCYAGYKVNHFKSFNYKLCFDRDSIFFYTSIFTVTTGEIIESTQIISINNSFPKIFIDSLPYSFVFLNSSLGKFMVMKSGKDSLIFYEQLKRTAQKEVDWEIRNVDLCYKTGPPATYEIFYYDTTDIKSYPLHPISIVKFRHGKKSGYESIFYPQDKGEIPSVKESRKWKKGILKATKRYEPGEKLYFIPPMSSVPSK